MTKTELEEYLDIHFTNVVTNANEATRDMDPVERAGTIAGFLLKTGIKLAAAHGAPQKIVETACINAVQEYYGS